MRQFERTRYFGIATKNYRYNQRLFLTLLEKNEKAAMLDIGCNDGKFTKKAADYVGTSKVYAIEIDKNSAKEAVRHGINVEVGDANKKFPYADNSFDIVISHQVLEHLINTDNFFSEIHRVCRPGGYAVISTSNLSALHNIFLILLGMQPTAVNLSEIQVGNFLFGTKAAGHIKAFNVSALKDLAKYHHFRVDKILGSGIYPLPIALSKILCKITPRYSLRLIMLIKPIKGENEE